MTSDRCDTCDGDGTIYDWSKKGDPCPDCDGRGFTFRGKVNMTVYNAKQNRGCVLSLLCLPAGAAELVYATVELVSMVTRA